MTSMPLVQVVIPNWNGHHLLPHCLEAIYKQTFSDFAVTVVDNGSTDGSVTWLQEHFPFVNVIANSENRGFAAAVNQGLRAVESKYVATLNNDAKPDPGWLEALVSAAESDPRIGMCASKMLFADQPHLINSAGICLDWAGIAWDCRGGEPDQPEERPTEIFGPCAGAALYRRKMLDEVGLFDEDFFAYLEDVDLAWRARLAGWIALYVPGARVYHAHSATLGEGAPFKSFLLGRNKVWLIVKNYPMPWLALYFPLILFYDWTSVLYAAVVRGDFHALRGRWAGFRKLPIALAKRQQIQALRKVNAREWRKTIHPVVPLWKVSARYHHLEARRSSSKTGMRV